MKPLDFTKGNGLIPVIIQDYFTMEVRMLGYMNAQAYARTQQTNKVTFYSRSRQKLWTKGEGSGNYLTVKSMHRDCDNDTLLIQVVAHGPTCHTGADNCFEKYSEKRFIYQLEAIIKQRLAASSSTSYTYQLFRKGINKMAQKVGEEAVELVIEAKDNHRDRFKNEAADLMYHYLLLLQAKGVSITEIESLLAQRHTSKKKG